MSVKIRRIMKKLSQKELAKVVGISNVTLVKIEKGNFDNVKFGTLKKIAELLDSSIEELFLSES
ncbi:helix-turn-helix transcriptional regulator [Clostridium beijerinckii]|uniref:helix-turn-helix transcriptional regulator n=1 Tax=Clostridium beijerinckii TaxID=1520 RepID=UPI00098C74EB|nr:helix-turn-helix transcriptional regulator [Clostridium beijerinckii]NRT78639.1 DNA-binding XRE family transcriptional regulator [Clostridium beijerinckii]OOM41364.1 anaerobic benzoate catabolism transcriptional regulator [Clostridium beijerinckii]